MTGQKIISNKKQSAWQSFPAISVIVPVYNTEKFLARCLDSILAQTFANLEIICVNDGSPDNSQKILDKYAKSNKRIKLIKQKNAGLSAARNAAIKIATGKYISFVDSDDTIEPDFYEKLFTAQNESNGGTDNGNPS